jgi:squalene cyclase
VDPVRRAVAFLLRNRDEDGWWRDFHLAAGASDEWVTAYVGAALAAVPGLHTTAAAAWSLLLDRRQRASGQWGYNGLTPEDADSTCWALRLAGALGAGPHRRAVRARTRLGDHRRQDGGIATYAEEGPIRRFIDAPETLGFGGWCGSHTCVTAAVAGLPELRDAVRPFLLARQQGDGSWRAYWWQDDEYATALAAEGLWGCGIAADRERVAAAAAWAAGRLAGAGVPTEDQPEGSPFATAWCLRLLELGGDPAAAARARTWLLEQQLPDGSWESSARLRVPHPDDEDPGLYRDWIRDGLIEGSLAFDHQRIFTTATVLAALAG